MAQAITKKFLEDVYLKQRLSTWAIEKKFGIPRSRIYTHLKRHGVPIRSIAQSHIRYARSDFSGNLCEKAYLLGFAIGDLRVRNHNGLKSETISIGCSSTKIAQINLIQDLFSKYGRVWKGSPGSAVRLTLKRLLTRAFLFYCPIRENINGVVTRRGTSSPF